MRHGFGTACSTSRKSKLGEQHDREADRARRPVEHCGGHRCAISAPVDWYRIQINNDVISSSETGLGSFASIIRGSRVVLAVCTDTTTNGTRCATANVLTPVGYPIYSNFPFRNHSYT